MKYVKKLLGNYWILSIFCIVLGIALIINPTFFIGAVGYVVGGMLVAYGAIRLIGYFASDNSPSGLVVGIIFCAAGVFIIVRPDFIPKVVAIICGLYMSVSGISNLQDALNLRKQGVENWTVSGIPAIITLVVGLILLFNPIAPAKIATMILGGALLVSGLSNIVGCTSAGIKLRKVQKLAKSIAKSEKKDDIIDI
jgi:uncharacterized membrane protein HdeD (DUF308 family)